MLGKSEDVWVQAKDGLEGFISGREQFNLVKIQAIERLLKEAYQSNGVLLKEDIIAGVFEKEKLFRGLLEDKRIRNISSAGLMMAVEFEDFTTNKAIIDRVIEKGVFTDWFLFAAHALRIVPPLNISEEDIHEACSRLISVL